jgi:hypothetical protein
MRPGHPSVQRRTQSDIKHAQPDGCFRRVTSVQTLDCYVVTHRYCVLLVKYLISVPWFHILCNDLPSAELQLGQLSNTHLSRCFPRLTF